LSEEKPIFYLNAPWYTVGSGAYNPPQRITINTSGGLQPTFITISQYNELLSQFMARGDEITRLQAVVKDVAHYLIARREVVGELSPAENALLAEIEAMLEVKE
jgi:hypothetical protein